jgi:hypothetical protein
VGFVPKGGLDQANLDGSFLRSSTPGAVRLILDESKTMRAIARAIELALCLPIRPPIGAGGSRVFRYN